MMRKQIVNPHSIDFISNGPAWLNLEHLAKVEITSEETGYPIESALTAGIGPGWLASETGKQTIRLLFDKPQALGHIHLVFEEARQERTHEFVLRWSKDGGNSYREILRQQYTFSPSGTTREVEDYTVNLDGVTALELTIVPDLSGGNARASLLSLLLE